MKNMNLTNMLKPSGTFGDTTGSFSKYISQEDKYDLPPSETSLVNQTLLIQSTPLAHKNSFCLSSAQSRKQSFILKKDRENLHFCDVNEEFQITINDHLSEKNKNKQTENTPLENLCGYLIKTIKDLQIKIENLQNKQKVNKKLNFLKDSQASQKNKNTLSFLNSTKQTEKQRSQKCQSCSKYKDFMQLTVQNIENKTKATVYRQQMQKTKLQLTKLQVLNEQYKREIQKLKGQNRKFKELVHQYQLYIKRGNFHNDQYFESANVQFDNKQIRNIQVLRSQICKSKRIFQRENSLDQKLQEDQSVEYRKSKRQNKFYSPDAFRRIENSQIFIKQTPKTPQQLFFRRLRQDNEKTELKIKHRSCNGLLKQIIEFEQKKERGIQNGENMYVQSNQYIKLSNNRKKHNYPNTQLLQRQLQNSNNFAKHYMTLSNFQTMESLQDIIYNQQYKINAQQQNKKVFHNKF